ncbi:hypothetical protein [Paraburkholderia tropica]|uniref:hypothetical protein n=1 Tax=Paraburkholderia tropica TaxID=92647 RepID=UPI002AB6509B|nr:hypothetical protein [Paraburkholderia tropica]
MTADVGIYEPLYAPGQEIADPAFIALQRGATARPEWREFGILVDMYRQGVHRQHRFTGLFSPKFNLKAKITGAQFVEFAKANSDADACFINPFPQIAYWSFNVWMQGEYAHPGLKCAAQSLCDASGLGWQIERTPRHDHRFLAYSNFWVGTEAFWERYVGGVLVPIAEFLETQPSSAAARLVMTDTTHTDAAPFLPFIIERLFSTFISAQPELNVVAHPLPSERTEDYCNSDFERLLLSRMRASVDTADCGRAYPAELIERMDLACALWQQHFFDYFEQRPHPHTNRTVSRD